MDSRTIEKLMIKSAFQDKKFLALISSTFEKSYFDDSVAGGVFDALSKHFKEYGNIIPRDTIEIEDVKDFYEEIDAIDFNLAQNYKYLIDNTNEYLKEKAVKRAILDSVEVINSNSEKGRIKQLIEDALCKDLNLDLGLDYFNTLGERLRRIMSVGYVRTPSYFPQFDEFINGGFPPRTLSVITAAIHSHKSSFLANISARQVLRGKNVALLTLEMSEDAYAQRYDAIFSNVDINKMYLSRNYTLQLASELKKIKEEGNVGKLFIKQYPTGKATVLDFSMYLRELRMRGIKLDAIFCDYINLMKPTYKTKTDMYSDVKGIAEELRAMSFEFEAPMISVTQLNREGSQIGFEEVDFTYTSESMGVPATADLQIIFGKDTEKAVYESEIQYKIVKNRLGGRVGEMSKFYFDARTLKMYDSLELEQWIEDANKTGDDRKSVVVVERIPQQVRGRKSRR